MKYLFDVDGTLTPHHAPATEEFREFFLEFANTFEVYLVTGGRIEQTHKQLGEDILNSVVACYSLNGSMKTKNGTVEYLNKWEPHYFLLEFLKTLQQSTKWKDIHTTNIDIRDTMVNFSIVGRDCPHDVRQAYYEWDKKEKERETICRLVNECYPDLHAVIGGQISVDISPKGTGKDQILNDHDEFHTSEICFFGDRMSPGGNDYPLGQRIADEYRGQAIEVDGWRDTLRLLSRIE